jgi:hypothetical protein
MSTANHFEPSLRAPGKAQFYQFHPFLLDTVQHVLLKEGRPVALTPKTYDTLLLVQNKGQLGDPLVSRTPVRCRLAVRMWARSCPEVGL